MLVLTRKPDEGLCIGKDIHITVLDVRGGKVRLGIEAPASVRIRRDELFARDSFLEIDFDLENETCGAR